MAEYIDRESALRAIYGQRGPCRSFAQNQMLDRLRAGILRIPAEDVAPVVHGRWDGDTCTACKLPWKYNMVQDADDWGYFDPMPD